MPAYKVMPGSHVLPVPAHYVMDSVDCNEAMLGLNSEKTQST